MLDKERSALDAKLLGVGGAALLLCNAFIYFVLTMFVVGDSKEGLPNTWGGMAEALSPGRHPWLTTFLVLVNVICLFIAIAAVTNDD